MNPADRDRLAAADALDSACDAFERACQSGNPPTIEEFLLSAPESRRPDLLVALVALDYSIRRRAGQTPAVEDYVVRFPEHATRLRSRLSMLIDSDHQSLGSTVARCGPDTVDTDFELPAVLSSGARLGRYELQDCLGRGSFGEVWRAWDPTLKRNVAIKTLRPDRVFPADIIRNFVTEGSKLAQFRHPAIVGVFDVAADHQRCYIVSEFIEGETLAARIERLPAAPSPREAVDLLAPLADALHHAHLQGIIHRDVKPSNILLDKSGRPFLADFGLAITEEEQLREPAGVVGTLSYMSPEQLADRSHHADARSDIYSIGVVLYRLLTGRLPFVADSREKWAEQILHRAPRPPRTINDAIPGELERICLKCLSKRVEDRYSTAADLARELRAALVEPARVDAPRWRAALVMGLGGALLLAALVPLFRNRRDLPRGDALVPQPLLWPLQDEVSNWSILGGGRKLHVACEQYGLLQLVELTRLDTTLEFEIGQIDWTGDVGVFWGYGKSDSGTDRLQFESLTVDTAADGFRLDRARMYFDRITAQPLEYEGISRAAIPDPASATHRMTLRFRNGRLAQVEWDGQTLPELATPLGDAGNAGETDESGRMGVLVAGTGATFSNVRLNGKPLLFREPAAP